ncbi:hypothetical protein ACVBEH_18640 [Roseateles sp. GG27B]
MQQRQVRRGEVDGCRWRLTRHQDNFDVCADDVFAAIGCLFYSLGSESETLLLGFILSLRMKENLRLTLLLSRGDLNTSVMPTLRAGLLIAVLLIFVVIMLPAVSE